uniref:Uncharacterized protein n=1 Tax=Arundo donax TaxID=35708 RepID=A0A0A9EPY1_ARUDO
MLLFLVTTASVLYHIRATDVLPTYYYWLSGKVSF